MKTDYNKSMLRFGAVVVASASMLGAASTMNAAPVAAPVYATEEGAEEPELTLQEENQNAFEADWQKIQSLQEKLTKVISTMNDKYLEFAEEEGLEKATAIGNSIDEMLKSCEEALNEANTSDPQGAYTSPLTDAWEDATNSDIDELEYLAKTSTVDGYNDTVYGQDSQKVADMQDRFSTLWNELEKSCPNYCDSDEGQKFAQSIYADLEKMYTDIKAVYDEANEAGEKMVSPLTDTFEQNFETQLEELEFNANDYERQLKNDEAYKACKDEINQLREDFKKATDPKNSYVKFIKRGADEAIESAIDELEEDVDFAYLETKVEGEFKFNVSDSVEAIEDMINKLVDTALKAEDDARKKANELAYGKYMTELSLLQEELSAACAETQPYYSKINWGVQESIYNELENLYNDAEKYYSGVEEAGEFDLIIDEDANAIRGAIALLVKKAIAAAKGADVQVVKDLQDKYDEETASDNEYASYLNRGTIEALGISIENLSEEVEAWWTAIANGDEYDPTFNATAKADSIEEELDYFVDKAKKAYEEARVKENLIAFNAYNAEIDALFSAWDDAMNPETDYYPYINRGLAESIYNEIELLKTDAEKYYQGVEEAGVFDLKIDDDKNAILGAINSLVEKAQQAYENVRVSQNETAYKEYMYEIKALRTELEDATNPTQPWAQFINRGVEESIANEITILEEDGEREWLAVAEAGTFDLDITDDAAMISGAIAKMVEVAKKAAAGDPEAYNDIAYGEVMTQLSKMQEEISNTWNELAAESTGIEYWQTGLDFAQSMYDELEAEYNKVEAYYEGLEEGEVFVSPVTGEFIDNFENDLANLKEAAAVFLSNWDAYQADGDKAQEIYNKYWDVDEELSAADPEWWMNEELNSIADQVWVEFDAIYERLNNAWTAYTDGDAESYVSPDITDLEANIDALLKELKDKALQTGVEVVEATAEKAEYYTIEGRKSNRAVRGQINIVRTADGKIQKVMVK